MLESSKLARKYKHICSFRKYTFQYQGPLNFADFSIFFFFCFCKKTGFFWPKQYLYSKQQCKICVRDFLVRDQKLGALARVSKYMTLRKRSLIMSSYITSQFNYCSLVWLVHKRKLNKKINKTHEVVLAIVYSDHKTSFSELLKTGKSVTIHQKNLQYLLIEIYKVIKGVSSTIANEIFSIFSESCL